MPELPDILVYISSLERLLLGKTVQNVIVKSPFVLRTFDPPLESVVGQTIESFSRSGKRIIWTLSNGSHLVFHLMITGRFHWKKPGGKPTRKVDLLVFQFDHGTMFLTEAGKQKRASLHVVESDKGLKQFDRKGLEVLDCSLSQFSERLKATNRTLKRALTDPSIFSGVGNAYSDEILLKACLSPLKRSQQLEDAEVSRLFEATQSVLKFWIKTLKDEAGESFPEKVTAFRPQMAAHGKFKQPCPQCEYPIQRIVYASNECNYCANCQTNGKVLADRSLSRLLKDEWPKTIEELERP